MVTSVALEARSSDEVLSGGRVRVADKAEKRIPCNA
jgi:hypothetical protein